MKIGLQVQISEREDAVVSIKLIGSADSETYETLEELIKPIAENNPRKVFIDLTGCSYISSAGIRVLFDFRKEINRRRGVVSLHNPQPHIRKILEVIKALPLECIFDSEAESDAYLNRLIAEDLEKGK